MDAVGRAGVRPVDSWRVIGSPTRPEREARPLCEGGIRASACACICVGFGRNARGMRGNLYNSVHSSQDTARGSAKARNGMS